MSDPQLSSQAFSRGTITAVNALSALVAIGVVALAFVANIWVSLLVLLPVLLVVVAFLVVFNKAAKNPQDFFSKILSRQEELKKRTEV